MNYTAAAVEMDNGNQVCRTVWTIDQSTANDYMRIGKPDGSTGQIVLYPSQGDDYLPNWEPSSGGDDPDVDATDWVLYQ